MSGALVTAGVLPVTTPETSPTAAAPVAAAWSSAMDEANQGNQVAPSPPLMPRRHPRRVRPGRKPRRGRRRKNQMSAPDAGGGHSVRRAEEGEAEQKRTGTRRAPA